MNGKIVDTTGYGFWDYFNLNMASGFADFVSFLVFTFFLMWCWVAVFTVVYFIIRFVQYRNDVKEKAKALKRNKKFRECEKVTYFQVVCFPLYILIMIMQD